MHKLDILIPHYDETEAEVSPFLDSRDYPFSVKQIRCPKGGVSSTRFVSPDDWFTWTTTDSEATVTGLQSDGLTVSDIQIPRKYNNLPVATIGSNAFESKSSIVNVEGATCISIGEAAFSQCTSLITASFPACTTIGNGAFAFCYSLRTLSSPSCTSIGNHAFRYCSSLTTASFPACTTIGNGAFCFCSSLTTVSSPVCETIGGQAFYSCSSLKTVSFPVCETIERNAFIYCYSLTTVSFPACTSIGTQAFRDCSSLTSVYFKASNMSPINSNVFQNANANLSIYVPTSLVDYYKGLAGWSIYASRITGFDDWVD